MNRAPVRVSGIASRTPEHESRLQEAIKGTDKGGKARGKAVKDAWTAKAAGSATPSEAA